MMDTEKEQEQQMFKETMLYTSDYKNVVEFDNVKKLFIKIVIFYCLIFVTNIYIAAWF